MTTTIANTVETSLRIGMVVTSLAELLPIRRRVPSDRSSLSATDLPPETGPGP